jgi:4-hydroxy 2-oxovalerate aldolase
LVLAYSLAVAKSGQASRILMAGFDGYPPGDARNDEIESMLTTFVASCGDINFASITPTSYKSLPSYSLYAL